jgi:hypothetical protein
VGGCCVHVFLNWNFSMNGGIMGSWDRRGQVMEEAVKDLQIICFQNPILHF